MAKTLTVQNPEDDFEEIIARPYKITKASIKDDFCNYSFQVIEGIGIGDKESTKGAGIIMASLKRAFAKLNVHLAVIDDVFKHSNTEIKNIDKMHGHELATLYTVTGFEIKGSDDDETISFTGHKFTSAGGYMDLKSKEIPMDTTSSYKWKKQLKESADIVRNEVARYKEGHCTPVEVSDEPDKAQGKFPFANGSNQTDDSFEDGKV